MAWSYETTRSPTATLSEFTFGVSKSASYFSTNTGVAGLTSSTFNEFANTSESASGSKAFMGTAGADFIFTYGTDTYTFWSTWAFSTSFETGATTVIRNRSYTSIYRLISTQTSYLTQFVSSELGTIENRLISNKYNAGGSTDGSSYNDTFFLYTNRTWITAFPSGTTTATLYSTGGNTSTASNSRGTAQYNYYGGTSADAITATATVTTNSISTYTQVTSAFGPSTTSFSSSASIVTSSTETQISSSIGYLTSSVDRLVLYDLVFEPDSTDWAWETTTSGNGIISDLATTVGNSTFSQRAFGITIPPEPSFTAIFTTALTTLSDTYWYYGWDGSTYELSTTETYEYTIGSPTNAAGFISLTNQSTITLVRAISFSTSFDWQTTYSTTSPNILSEHQTNFTYLDTYQDSLTTSLSLYPFTTTTTYVQASTYGTYSVGVIEGSFSTLNSYGSFGSTYRNVERPNTNSNAGTFIDNGAFLMSSFAPDTISFVNDAVIGGFQPWSSAGPGKNYGSNLDAGFQFPIRSFAEIYPGIIVPVFNQTTEEFTIGTVTATTQYVSSAGAVFITQKIDSTATSTTTASAVISSVGTIDTELKSFNSTASTIGGYGWNQNSTYGSEISCSRGVHSFTSLNSSLGVSLGTTTWSAPHFIFRKNAMNFESLPDFNIVATDRVSKQVFVTIFPAFP